MVQNVIMSNGDISFVTYLELANSEKVQFTTTITADPLHEIDTLFRIGEAITLLAETVQTWIERNKPDDGWKLVSYE